jgi:hypothetical protein
MTWKCQKNVLIMVTFYSNNRQQKISMLNTCFLSWAGCAKGDVFVVFSFASVVGGEEFKPV